MLETAGHRVRLYDPIYHPESAALERSYDFVTCTEVVEHMHRPADEFRAWTACFAPAACWA